MFCWFEDIKELTADISPASAGTLLHANLLMNAGGLHLNTFKLPYELLYYKDPYEHALSSFLNPLVENDLFKKLIKRHSIPCFETLILCLMPVLLQGRDCRLLFFIKNKGVV